jgi:putative transposase
MPLMSDYRRYYVAGGTYFFTLVTHERRPILATDLARKCLHDAIATVQAARPFEIPAIVLLPDHLARTHYVSAWR